jgi:hypothetical protein
MAVAAGQWWWRHVSGGGGSRAVAAAAEPFVANSGAKKEEREAEEPEGAVNLAAGVARRPLSMKVYKIVPMSFFHMKIPL